MPKRAALLAFGIVWVGATRVAGAEPATPTSDPLMMASLDAVLALPQGDADDLVDTSPGMRVTFAYRVHPFIAVVGAFEYVFANENSDVGDSADITFYSIGVGARVASPRLAPLRPFGELLIGRHTVSYDTPLGDDSESDIGFRLGGGVLCAIGSGLTLIGQLSYTTAEIEHADIDGLVLEAGIGWAF